MNFISQIVDTIFPSIGAYKVYSALSTPKFRKLKKFEENALDSAKKEKIGFKNYEIQTYIWGDEYHKTVLPIHGWEGHAGNFGALISILLDKGYKIISFDAPSHGSSSVGKTNMFEFTECSSAMMKKYNPNFIISHSFGSVSSIVSISENQDVEIEKWIMITTPNDYRDRMNGFADYFKLSDRARKELVNIVEKDSKVRIRTLNMTYYGKLIPNMKEAIIIHSKADIVLPIEQARSAKKAIPKSRLIEIEKAGHFNILWSSRLKELVMELM
jgi:pimeloyl-ACP methyl ester carboxylesterase